MSKKGETGEQDRGKPQPRKKKEREDARKKKKLERVERQQSRQGLDKLILAQTPSIEIFFCQPT
jgi:hypothetical protein